MKRLAIVTTHPIQYNAPVFRMLSQRGNIKLRVYYTRSIEARKYDSGFGQDVEWDIPLLEGYDYQLQPGGGPKNNRALQKAVLGFRPDAVLIYGWNPPGHFSLMRFLKKKVPVWFRGDSTLLDERPGLKKWIRRAFLTFAYRYVDLAFYVGTNNKAYFLAHGLREGQLVFAPHAIDNERFFDSPDRGYEEKAEKWRKELGIMPDDFVVLFAGKMDENKAPDFLLDAVCLVNKKRKLTIHLVLAGSGILEKKLRDVGKALHYIHFVGFQNQSQMPVIYRIADVFCLPSRSETWGLSVNEAMACGRSIITSDKVGCAVDLIASEKVGQIFTSMDLLELVNAISLLCSRAKSASRFNPFSAEKIRDWSYENVCEVFLSAINLTNDE